MYEIDELLKKIKRIHFIGIGGSGMCPIAEIMLKKGYEITGSDNNESDNLERMRGLGIPVILGQKAENIAGAEMIIYTSAILSDNPELAAAKESGIPLFERNELLGAITRSFSTVIGVAGTHGKTTTSSMASQVLIEAGLSPSAVIGGKLPLTGTNGIVGSSDIMVCESCEFQDHYLKLSPDIAVILNVDEDHLEYFKNLDNIKRSFASFAGKATKAVVYNGDDANTVSALGEIIGSGKKCVSFGLDEGNDFRAVNITNEHEYYSFDTVKDGATLGRITLGVPGIHNVSNALSVIAACMLAGADFEDCKKGISHFAGAGRRFEKLAEIGGVTVLDDYAHHPKELEVTLSTLMKMGYGTVYAIFQPFTFSRTAMLLDDFARVLSIPDRCLMTPIMGSREINTYGISTADLAAKIPGSRHFASFEEVARCAASEAKSGDCIITLGCGDIYKAAKIIIKMLEESI